jgi:hypothetical protein
MTSSTPQFTKLNVSISLFEPPVSTFTTGHELDPTTILIFQWMGASPRSRSLNSVYEHYHAIYPFARLISVRSLEKWFMTTSNPARLSIFKPITSAILNDPTPIPRILVHLFSNGGSLSLLDTCTIYKQELGKILQIKAIILDSAPGQSTLKEAGAALSVGLPRGLLWYPSAMIMAFLLSVAGFSQFIRGTQSIVEIIYKELNNWELVDRSAARLYIYSESDKLVGWKDVERHAMQAEESHVPVKSLRKLETQHVQHMMQTKDREEYWQQVEELWNQVRQVQASVPMASSTE